MVAVYPRRRFSCCGRRGQFLKGKTLKRCLVISCKGVILRGSKYCQAHIARLRKTGSLQTHRPIKYLNHGRAHTPIYRSWSTMKNRCLNKNTPDYKYYGGRGITLCFRWHDFKNFRKDMGEKPTPLHTIGRINNAKGYSKANCQWETRKQQSQNHRGVKCNLKMARDIRRQFAAGVWQKDLAKKFKLSVSAVGKITRRELWI